MTATQEQQQKKPNRRKELADMARADLKDQVKQILSNHKGRDNAITMIHLYAEATGEVVIPNRKYDQTRVIRSIIEQLRREGIPVAISSYGYFVANTDEELETTIKTFHSRAMSSLRQEAALKRIDTDQLFDQYKLELQENPHDSAETA